ncbi:hypothetical protein [Mobilicoccus massiliensis]|uniref:hypothetical protein n=1 Tax=Mobilicoccus massiliensis TaxID=1522310 RepID=UPI0011412765|nr:hypothetical protein [Mobilicoccus massiliensis]
MTRKTDAAAVKRKLWVNLRNNQRVPAWLRLMSLAILKCNEDGVAAFNSDEIRESFGLVGENADQRILDTLIAYGYAMPGSTPTRVTLNHDNVAVWKAPHDSSTNSDSDEAREDDAA